MLKQSGYLVHIILVLNEECMQYQISFFPFIRDPPSTHSSPECHEKCPVNTVCWFVLRDQQILGAPKTSYDHGDGSSRGGMKVLLQEGLVAHPNDSQMGCAEVWYGSMEIVFCLSGTFHLPSLPF